MSRPQYRLGCDHSLNRQCPIDITDQVVAEPAPVAAEAVIAYGLPATVAVCAAPALVNVTDVTLSVLTRPVGVNSVPANVTVSP